MNFEQIISLVLSLFQNNQNQNQNQNNYKPPKEDYSSSYWNLPNYEQENFDISQKQDLNPQTNQYEQYYNKSTQNYYIQNEQNAKNDIISLLSQIDLNALIKLFSSIQEILKVKTTKTEKKEPEPSFISHLTKTNN
ncbi:MAG: hypothetical protein IJ837_00860 [Clostridia bacterium]|nr:hypothetical protein [Clostridia bacterium]